MRLKSIFLFTAILIIFSPVCSISQAQSGGIPAPGFESRIKQYIDTLHIIDTHEHLLEPEILKSGFFLDFSMLFMQNGYDDLISAGMPDSLYDELFNQTRTPLQKWKMIEPYWKNSFNTSFNRTILSGIRSLYGINGLNESTVGPLSDSIKKAYETNWFDRLLRDSCRIRYILLDANSMKGRDDYFRFARRFESWITVRSKYRIDSIAISQLDPIYTLDDFVKSMKLAFDKEYKKGMTVVKVFSAYFRTLDFEKTDAEAAKKVFKNLVNGEEDYVISYKDAKPLQDYMLYQLMGLADKYKVPVAFHTGIQAGKGKIVANTDPELLTNLFNDFPGVNFVLYHGSYPYGGQLSALAKNYTNVYIDMNWSWALSPSYAERYLNEWLEMVPVSRLTAFGGDCMVPENVYTELKAAKKIISNVLSAKVRNGYITEQEAKDIARMMFFDNASRLYNLH